MRDTAHPRHRRSLRLAEQFWTSRAGMICCILPQANPSSIYSIFMCNLQADRARTRCIPRGERCHACHS